MAALLKLIPELAAIVRETIVLRLMKILHHDGAFDFVALAVLSTLYTFDIDI